MHFAWWHDGSDAGNRWGVHPRKVKGEFAAFPWRALYLNLSAQQARDLATDRESETGAAVLATRRAVRLLESFKNDLLLVARDPDACINDRERQHAIRLIQHGMLAVPAGQDFFNLQPDRAATGEFDGVRQQVLEHLLEPHGIRLNRGRQSRDALDNEFQAFILCHLPEASIHVIGEVCKAHRADRDSHRPGLDLGEIENVVDQGQQIAP